MQRHNSYCCTAGELMTSCRRRTVRFAPTVSVRFFQRSRSAPRDVIVPRLDAHPPSYDDLTLPIYDESDGDIDDEQRVYYACLYKDELDGVKLSDAELEARAQRFALRKLKAWWTRFNTRAPVPWAGRWL